MMPVLVPWVACSAMDWLAFSPRHGPVPRYRQVALFVRAAIEDGKLKPGESLPTETQLAEYMSVSVDTIRAALQVLRDEGLIVTSQGIGSFVTERK